VPEAIGVGAKSLSRAIAAGSVEDRFLDPWPCAPSAVAADLEGNLWNGSGSGPNHGFRWFGMFERSSVVLVGTFICRSRTGARGLEAQAKSERRRV